MTSLPALAGTLEGLHAALTARHFDALVLFDPSGRELARAGGTDLPELRLDIDAPVARVAGLPADLQARETPLHAYGRRFAHLVLLWRGAPPDAAAEMAARAAADLVERLGTLDYEIDNLSRELAESYESIHLLFDVTGASTRSRSASELAAAMLEQLCRHVRCRCAAVLLESEAGANGDLVRVAATLGHPQGLPTGALVARKGAVARWLAGHGAEVVDQVRPAADGVDDPVAANATRSLLVAPLVARDQVAGAIVLFDREGREGQEDREGRGRFDSRDRKLADAVAAHAGALLLSLRMVEVTKELEIGRRIQQSLLPARLPRVPGLDVAGWCAMAKAMGGDFYDAVALPSGELRAVIADVSGHDLGAALLMAAARAQFHAELGGARQPGALATRMNALLHQDLTRAGLFLTFFLVAIDRRRGRLRWSAGGHNPPLLLRHGEATPVQLPSPGVPAGCTREARFPQRGRSFAAGDLLLLYTDGFTESARSDGTLFGEERLGQVLVKHRACPAQELLKRLGEELADFRGGEAAKDDGTALLIRAEELSLPLRARPRRSRRGQGDRGRAPMA